MRLPTIRSYGQGKYASENYGIHCQEVQFKNFTLYYSYKTIVAYWDDQDGLVCTQNIWSTTTGKHLNWLCPNHDLRIPNEEFNKKLEAMIERHTK